MRRSVIKSPANYFIVNTFYKELRRLGRKSKLSETADGTEGHPGPDARRGLHTASLKKEILWKTAPKQGGRSGNAEEAGH